MKTDNSANAPELFQPYIDAAIVSGDDELQCLLEVEKLRALGHTPNYERNALLTIISKSKKQDWKEVLAIAYQSLSGHYIANHQAAEELKYLLLAYDIYKDWDYEYFIHKQEFIYNIAIAYFRADELETANKYFNMALAIPDSFIGASQLNTIALSYTNAKNLDSALYFYDLAYNFAKDHKLYRWQNIIAGNAIGVFIIREQYDTSLALSFKILDIAENNLGKKIQANLLSTIGFLYLKKNDLIKSEQYFDSALLRYRSMKENWYYSEMIAAEKLYRRLGEVKADLGKYKIAYKYTDTAKLIRDSLSIKVSAVKLKEIEKDYARSKLVTAQQLLELEQKNALLQRNLLITIVIVGGLLATLIIGFYRKRKDLLEKEKNVAKYDLKASQDKLAVFTNTIQEKNKLLEGLEKKLTSYESDEKTVEYAETISEMQGSTILTDDDWIDFRKNFDKAHPGYLSRLQKNHPTLSQAELRYIVLAKINLSTKEMASVLGVTAGSVRTTKSRLIKKIGFENEDELKELIDNL
ncbi:MAG: hypothetical protein H6551_07510 [Chitinophagales bacterium]|nr:hypothetical protein [Chitinophagaceae bacterium]MCB9064976.1 hypothetical protein [Chitinophagales bacterium]